MRPSEQHVALVRDLYAESRPTWSHRALLACLERLMEGGPTDGHLISVFDAWSIPARDGFCVIYSHPCGEKVGVCVLKTSSDDYPLFLNADGSLDMNNAREFGVEVADYVIAEPLGSIADTLIYDNWGIGWWGEPPLPPKSERDRI